jgi:transposase
MIFILIIVFCCANFVFVDESGINQSFQREYGRALRGQKVEDTKRGRKFARTNIISGLFGDKHVATQIYTHSTTADFFNEWFEWDLIAEIPEFSVVIMDNASFHRKKGLYEIASRYNIILLFLPPYSPDLNPIEHSWANLKRWLCVNISRFPSLDFAIDCYFNA